MKKIIFFIMAIALVFALPFNAFAWGIDDINPETDLFFTEGSFPLTQNNASPAGLDITYGVDLWPEVYEYHVSGVSNYFTLFETDIDFLSGHGLMAIFSLPLPLNIEHVDYISFYLRDDGAFTRFARIKYFPASGEYVYETGLYEAQSLFDDDGVGFLGQVETNFVQLVLSGTLLADVDFISVNVYLTEDAPENFDFAIDYSDTYSDGPLSFFYTADSVLQPVVDQVKLELSISAPYYPGTDVQLNAQISGTGIEPGSPESSFYLYVHGNTSDNTYLEGGTYGDAILHIGNDETATALEIEAISAFDTTQSDSVTIPVSYPLLGSMIAPSGTQTLVESSKRQELQFELILPNGEPFNYTDIEWTVQGSSDTLSFFRIDDQGLLVVEPSAPAGASCTVHFAYGFNTSNVSLAGVTVKIVSMQEGIYDNLTPTPDQNDKAEEMEDAISDAAGKLENNNSSLGQLTPTRPQINTNLEFDQEQMLAVSPLVTNIWSINGLGRMISIVLVVATVAYIFFGKRDG